MRGFRGWHERGYLPHRDEPGLTQFVTFHLADSFPGALRSEWEALLQVEDDREQRKQPESYLDRGQGDCHLRRTAIAKLVEDALRFHHQQWYELLAWVVMPNHVHLLIAVGETPLSKIVKELKRYTAREANKLLGCRARVVPNPQQAEPDGSFWGEDYFDTFMRNEAHRLQTRRYIESNPVKAFLAREPKDWP